MITNSEFVSRIVNSIKALSKDGHISRRFILGIGAMKAKFLMSQKLDELTMFKEEGVFTHIPCFELSSVDVKKCDIFEFRVCDRIMKSDKKLPEGVFGKNGPGIIRLTNVDGSVNYDYIQPRKFSELKKRKYTRDTSKYYYVKDGYLYLPNSSNEIVEITMLATKGWEVLEVSSCSGGDSCKSFWEYDFVCPDRFLDLVVKDTLQEVASIYARSVEDSNPNMDPNSKGKTTK